MAVTRVCYCNREDAQRSVDFADTQISYGQIDRALESATETIEGELHRRFYPIDTTYKWDWPNYQYAYPWRLWLDEQDIISLTSLSSPPNTSIPLQDVILYPANRQPGFPFTRIELDRSTSAAWGGAPTPQLSIVATGTFGFTNDQITTGALAAAISSTSATQITVTDSSQLGAGDMVTIDSERIVIADKAMTVTGLTQSGQGVTTAVNSDNALTTTGTGALLPGEVIALDQERMLVTDVTGTVATVKRAWDGTVLATHSAAVVNAGRLLTVIRGEYGTNAATHLINAPVSKLRVPAKIRSLCVAETVNQVLQETSGYARTVGAPDAAMPAPGTGLAELWDEATTRFGRKARIRAI